MLDIYDEFRSLIAALAAHRVDYALCGGMAMAVHERPRMTVDIDLLIQPESFERGMQLRRSGQDLDDIQILEEGGRDAQD